MPLGRLEVCGNMMWMVVSHVDGEAEFVSRFTLTTRGEDVYLNLGASCEQGYPVVKGNFLSVNMMSVEMRWYLSTVWRKKG